MSEERSAEPIARSGMLLSVFKAALMTFSKELNLRKGAEMDRVVVECQK